jgi:pyruvate decarboxylase/indolepyruvate decarboxylase
MYKHVSEANTVLTAQNAVSEIERVLSVAVNEKKPVYISIAEDVCNEYIDDNFALTKKRSDCDVLAEVTTKIIQKLKSAKKPVILSDSIVFRFNLENKIEKLINTLQIPASVLYMGKGSIDENHPLFLGVYSGQLLNKDVANFVEDSDCILSLGAMMTDFNTGAIHFKTQS